MGFYAFTDTTQTYTDGQQVSQVSPEAGAACAAVARAAGDATTGSSTVQSALTTFQQDVNTAKGELQAEIEGLGASTQETAATGEQTAVEGASLQHGSGTLARDVNLTGRSPIRPV